MDKKVDSQRKAMLEKNKRFSYVYILLVYIGLSTAEQGLFNVSYSTAYYVGILIVLMCMGICVYNNWYRISINFNMLFYGKLIWIPTVVAFIYSILVNLLYPSGLEGYFTRALGIVMYTLLAVLQAYFSYLCFGKSVIKYTFIAVALSFLTSTVIALSQDGLGQFIGMLTDSSYSGSVLEMHEVAPIAAMFAIYYWYMRKYRRDSWKKTAVREAVCLFIIICSTKRIVLLSCFLMIGVFELMRLKKKSVNYMYNVCRIISIFFIAVLLLFVWGIRSGFINEVFVRLGINTMSRAQLWSGMDGNYSFSPFFFGRGIGFVSKWMDYNWATLNINGLHGSTGIHSDILKYFIELGFWGSCIYFWYFLFYITGKIRERNKNDSFVLYFLLILFQFLIWFTDNISIYHNFLWILYLMIFVAMDLNYPLKFSKNKEFA